MRDRRFVERERGTVFAFGFFDNHRINWTWQMAALFRVENGQIRRIEAIFNRAPFSTYRPLPPRHRPAKSPLNCEFISAWIAAAALVLRAAAWSGYCGWQAR